MKKYILFTLVCFCSLSYAATPSRLIYGKVQFAVSDVNGYLCWTPEERQKAIDHYESMGATVTYTVMDFAQTAFEVALASAGIKFENYSDYKNCLENKAYLEDRLDDLRESEKRKLKGSINYLKSENSKR